MTIDQELLDAANTIKPPSPKTYFGEVYNLDIIPYFMKKGEKKRLFDKTMDLVENRRLEIGIGFSPLTGQYTIDRTQMEFDKGWQEVTLPSLKKLGKSVADLQGNPFVQVQLVACGTYINKTSGETKNLTFLRFVEFYPDRTACEDAAAAFFNHDADDVPAPAPTPQAAPQPAASTAPPAPPAVDEATAKSFLEILWSHSKGDENAFKAQLAANPMLAEYPLTHPLVQGVMQQVLF